MPRGQSLSSLPELSQASGHEPDRPVAPRGFTSPCPAQAGRYLLQTTQNIQDTDGQQMSPTLSTASQKTAKSFYQLKRILS